MGTQLLTRDRKQIVKGMLRMKGSRDSPGGRKRKSNSPTKFNKRKLVARWPMVCGTPFCRILY